MSTRIRKLIVGVAFAVMAAVFAPTATMNAPVCCYHDCGGGRTAWCCYDTSCGFWGACMETYFGCWACCGSDCRDITC